MMTDSLSIFEGLFIPASNNTELRAFGSVRFIISAFCVITDSVDGPATLISMFSITFDLFVIVDDFAEEVTTSALGIFARTIFFVPEAVWIMPSVEWYNCLLMK